MYAWSSHIARANINRVRLIVVVVWLDKAIIIRLDTKGKVQPRACRLLRHTGFRGGGGLLSIDKRNCFD